MKKQQVILLSGGLVLLLLLFFFGQTVPPKKKNIPPMAAAGQQNDAISSDAVLAASKKQLTPAQQDYVGRLENAVVRGDVKVQQVRVYRQLANFYKDSVHLLLPYGYYMGKAAELENSEKNLTFAAQFFLDGVRGQDDPGLKKWMATEAQKLFEQALALDPANDSLKVGLGSCYLFGNISETPMQGIQMIKEVVDRDPGNLYAQFTLAMGGMISGQFDKAIERLLKVVKGQPGNAEAVLMLADAYERTGNNQEAIRWYEAGKKLINNPEVAGDIDKRINALKK